MRDHVYFVLWKESHQIHFILFVYYLSELSNARHCVLICAQTDAQGLTTAK